jgi:CCR4-NOT complex subunit CAF16
VQLTLGLARPYQLLLLDEITADLDLVVRSDMLEFLREESTVRGASVIYATHILDRLEAWATDALFLQRGRLVGHHPLSSVDFGAGTARLTLAHFVESWLRGASLPTRPTGGAR